MARHLQYAGPGSCLALEIGDSSRLMRYESGLAASPFARSATRNTSHLLCPELGVTSGEPAGRDSWLWKSYVTGWLTTDSWTMNLQHNTQIASRVFQVMSHNWWEVMVFILFNTGKVLINALHRYVYVTRFSIVNVSKDPVKTTTITSKTGVKQLCLLQIESSICHDMACKHFFHTFITYDFIMITSVTYGTILTVHIGVSKFIHIYRHTSGLDSVIDDGNNGNSEKVVVL